MPVEHSPVENQPDGKTALSKCNNQERKWAAQVTQQTQVLQMQVQGILRNDEAVAEDYENLEKEIRQARRSAVAEWEVHKNDFELRGREEALQQLARKWQTEEQKMADAVLEINQARHAKFPTGRTLSTTPSSNESTPGAGQAGRKETNDRRMAQQTQGAAAAATPAGSTAANGARRKAQPPSKTADAGAEQPTRGEAADALASFKDLQAEVLRMRQEMRQQVTQTWQLNEDWQHKMNEALRRQEAEFKKTLTEERQRHEQARNNWERRAAHRFSQENGQQNWRDRSSTPDRARTRGRGGQRGGPRARLYSEGDAWQSFQENAQRAYPGERSDEWQQNFPNQPCHPTHPAQHTQPRPSPPLVPNHPPPSIIQAAPSASLQNPIISRYAANIPNYGQNEQKYTILQAAGDESDDYYRQNFPFPFNEPPPPDARVISDYKKLEGMAPKFSGKEEDFPTWAALFLEVIHKVKCPMGWKALRLAACLDTTDERLREIHDGTGATRADYARTISRLVRAYGHPQGELAARREALDQIHLVQQGDFVSLEKWHMRLENLADAARNLGKEVELTDYRLYEENIRKMEYALAQEYYNWCRVNRHPNDTITLLAWLGEAVDTARKIRRMSTRTRPTVQQHVAVSHPVRGSSGPGPSTRGGTRPGPRRTPRPCPMDGETHPLALCENFKKLDPFERREKLKEWKRCYACLNPGHNIKECGRGVVCQLCQHRHHTLLHGTSRSQARATRAVHAYVANERGGEEEEDWSEDSAPEEEDEVQEQVVLKADKQKRLVALQTLPITLYNGRREVHTNLLMDQGATGAFISKSLADRLGLVGHIIESTVTGFDGVRSTGPAVMTHVQLSAYGSKKRHWIQVQVSKDPAGSYNPYDWSEKRKQYPHIAHIPVRPPVPGVPVEIMIGMDTPHLVSSLVPDIEVGDAKQPVARKTRLGWVVAGPTGERSKGEHRSTIAFFTKNAWTPTEFNTWGTHQFRVLKAEAGRPEEPQDAREVLRSNKSKDDELQQLVSRMWEVDAACAQVISTPAEERIFQELKQKLTVQNGRYQLPTLWKKGEPNISNNYGYALGRLRSLLKSPNYNRPEVKEQYQKQLQEWQEEDYVEEVHTEQPQADRVTYLPHFPVVRMDKTSTQIRIVMDAAAKASRGKSLNDCLYKGPKLVNELITVLMRFRMKITLAADIKKMFYQIVLEEEERLPQIHMAGRTRGSEDLQMEGAPLWKCGESLHRHLHNQGACQALEAPPPKGSRHSHPQHTSG